ncbi:gustatory receptor for sugar taste 43a-like isoform X2 [Athalia rosae]|uniref:gustatory receptor for sugar taste 43a-like isoform X2 n=1 Tax=Athalia rosae TaxID=37344 RepID=UPI0020336B43|nr:gustatory receptor for sugar taste 43a-like isoform X2 [Athalia rosae]
MKITAKDDVDKHPRTQKNSNRRKQASVTKMTRTDLYQALFPSYYLSKAWGILPVRFTKTGPEKYLGRLHFVDITYSTCLLLVMVCAEFWGLWRDLHDGWEHSTRMKSKTAVVVTCSDIMAVALLAAVSILGAPFRWNKIQAIMDRLVEVDEKLGIVALKKTRRFCIVILSGTLIYFNALSIIDYLIWVNQTKKNVKLKDKGAINYVPLYFLYVSVMLMEVQIALAAYSLEQRFARLNKSLENLMKTEKLPNLFPSELSAGDFNEHGQFRAVIRGDLRGEPLFRIRKISDIELIKSGNSNLAETIYDMVTVHSSLSDTVLLINNAFGFPALIAVLTCLLHLIITPYFLILEANGEHNEFFLVVQLMWCVGHVGRLLIIVQPCYAASVQIAGAVTTYLVILIQFQKDDDTKETNTILKNATMLLKNATVLHNTTWKHI